LHLVQLTSLAQSYCYISIQFVNEEFSIFSYGSHLEKKVVCDIEYKFEGEKRIALEKKNYINHAEEIIL